MFIYFYTKNKLQRYLLLENILKNGLFFKKYFPYLFKNIYDLLMSELWLN